MPAWVWTVSPLVWSALLLGVAVVMMLVGLRGRRIGDEPRCRRCGYELTGLESTNCPECGRVDVLKQPRRGWRRRGWFALIAGSALLVAVTVGTLIFLLNSGWRQYVPTAALQYAMDFGDHESARELHLRIRRGDIGADEMQALIESALTVQAEAHLGSSRLAAWMLLLFWMDEAGILNDAQWERKIQQTLREFDVAVRPRTRVGDHIPIHVRAGLAAPPGAELMGRLRVRPRDQNISAVALRSLNGYSVDSVKFRVGDSGQPIDFDPVEHFRFEHDLPVGAHEIELSTRAIAIASPSFGRYFSAAVEWPPSRRATVMTDQQAYDRLDSLRSGADMSAYPGFEKSAQVRRSLQSRIQVLLADSDEDIDRIRGEAVRDKLRSILKFRECEYAGEGHTHGEGCGGFRPRVVLTEPAPWPMAFEMQLRQGARTVHWLTFTASAGDTEVRWHFPEGLLDVLSPGRVEVVLVPVPQVSRNSVDPRVVDEAVDLGTIDFYRSPASSASQPAAGWRDLRDP